jgi:predicted NBD/HSP70 family sugar kinase
MSKISTMRVFGNEIFKEQTLTIGFDLGDRWSFHCVLDEAGKIILEQKVSTTPEAMKQTFGKIPRSLIALGDRNTFAMGKPTFNRARTRSDRGARTKSAIDQQEQSKR